MSSIDPAGTVDRPDAGCDTSTAEAVRVDLVGLRRTAAEFADLSPAAEDQAFAAALDEVRASAATAASTEAAAEVVDAAQAELRQLAATTLELADGLAEAARRYSDSDHRASLRAPAGDEPPAAGRGG